MIDSWLILVIKIMVLEKIIMLVKNPDMDLFQDPVEPEHWDWHRTKVHNLIHFSVNAFRGFTMTEPSKNHENPTKIYLFLEILPSGPRRGKSPQRRRRVLRTMYTLALRWLYQNFKPKNTYKRSIKLLVRVTLG